MFFTEIIANNIKMQINNEKSKTNNKTKHNTFTKIKFFPDLILFVWYLLLVILHAVSYAIRKKLRQQRY